MHRFIEGLLTTLGLNTHSQQIHDVKNSYASEMLPIQTAARKEMKKAQALSIKVDTVYFMAKATGGIK